MVWTEETTEAVWTHFEALPWQEKTRIEILAMQLFVQMKVVGLCTELPASVPQLDRDQCARLLQVAMNLDACFLQTSISKNRTVDHDS